MKRRTAGLIVEPTGPPLPRGARPTAKVRQALANYHAMQAEPPDRTTPEYRRASAALDYILKVLTPSELAAYYAAIRAR